MTKSFDISKNIVWQAYKRVKANKGAAGVDEQTMSDFWARGYFCVTSGELTKAMIQEYLEHHFEKDPDDQFDIE